MMKVLFITLCFLCNLITFAQTPSALRNDGAMLVGNQLFFPIGYYAESFNTLSQNNYAANTLSAAGFNIMFTEHDIQITTIEFGSFLDNCASKGIYNILSFWDPSTAIDAKMNTFIPAFKNKPSVLVWGIGDDASTLGTESDILRKHNLAVSLDPNHLTYESFNGAIRNTAIATVGQSASQAYPKFLSGDLMDGYNTWGGFVELVAKCNASGKTPMANLQTYKWTTGNFIYPSAAECDVESYLAIVAGMKGLLYYTFSDLAGSTINLTQPNLWNASVKVASEINTTLKDVLLNGVRTTTANTVDHVYYSKWVYNNETYVIAVNAGQVAHSVSIPVTGNTLTNLFSYRTATLSLTSNRLSGNLAPLQVQIYKVSTSGGAAQQTGTAYRWFGNNSSTSNGKKTASILLNDNSTSTTVWLKGGTAYSADSANAYESAGLIFGSAKNISSFEFVNGAYGGGTADGAFGSELKIQTTNNGTTWADASGWSVSPTYSYGNASIGNTTFVFTGSASNLLGIRVTGKVRLCKSGCSWEASLKEIKAVGTNFPGSVQNTRSSNEVLVSNQ